MEDLSKNAQSLIQQGVHLIGDFSGRSALCQIGRDFIELTQGMGLPVQILDLPISPDRMTIPNTIEMSEVDYAPPKSSLSIICWNPDGNALLVKDLPREIFHGRRIIGIWFWETENLPDSHAKGYDLVDEIWVTSKFIAEALSKNSPVPVKHFPHLLKAPQPPENLKLPQALLNDRFLFLFSFDFRSVSKRKNPHAVCEAFVRAFPVSEPNGPICLIKSIAGRPHHVLEFLELRHQFKHRPDIMFMDEWLSPEERDSLMARADCYVSLHRAEGLGLTLMESMSLAKPCIATAYSGNLDFMTPENSWLVPYKTIPIGEGVWPYPPADLWAEPDLDVAAKAMVEVFTKPDLALKKGRLGKETIIRNHEFNTVSTRVRELLEENINAPASPKRALESKKSEANASNAQSQASGRTQAYGLLKQVREKEKELRKQYKALKSWRLPDEVKECMTAMLDIIKLQQQAQMEALNDLGELKKRLHGYHGATLDGLVRDRELTRKTLDLTTGNEIRLNGRKDDPGQF